MSGAWLNCVIFSLRVSFTRYSQQDVLLTHPNKFPFLLAKGVISTAHVGWFSRALTCFACSNIHIKNYSAIARRKNIPFYPARTGMNFSASEALIQISQPANLRRFFFPASSNSAWRAGILSSGSVGYSWLFPETVGGMDYYKLFLFPAGGKAPWRLLWTRPLDHIEWPGEVHVPGKCFVVHLQRSYSFSCL